MYRSAAWRESVSFTYSLEATTAYLYEFVLLILLPFRGSIGIANYLTWMASAENVSTMKASEFNREVGILEWLDRPEYSAEVSQAKHAIVMELQRLSEQSYEVWEETVASSGDAPCLAVTPESVQDCLEEPTTNLYA